MLGKGARIGIEAMSRHAEQQRSDTGGSPSPLAGLLFLIGGLGGLFGLISAIDPLL